MLGKALGYELPKVTALRSFLERFHDEELARKRPSREEQKSFDQRGKTLYLPMAVQVRFVRRPRGEFDGEKRDDRRDEVEPRMGCLRQNTQASSPDSYDHFHSGDDKRSRDR